MRRALVTMTGTAVPARRANLRQRSSLRRRDIEAVDLGAADTMAGFDVLQAVASADRAAVPAEVGR